MAGQFSAEGSTVFKPFWMGLLAIPIMLSISIWNGYPLVYEDTYSYLERPATVGGLIGIESPWDNKVKGQWLKAQTGQPATVSVANAPAIKANRSIYYGTFAYLLTLVGGLWAVVAGQAAVLGIVVALLWYRCIGMTSDLGFAGLLVGLTLGTSAGLFANLVMPDILTGLMIAAAAMLLAFWRQLLRIDRAALAGVAVLGVISHPSHVMIVAAIMLGAGLIRLLVPLDLRAALPAPALALGTGVVAVGIAATLVFGLVVKATTGQTPMRLPFVTAHLASQPVLASFLNKNCDAQPAQWAVCAYRQHLPMVWTDFLFGRGRLGIAGSDAAAAKDRLLSEQEMPLLIAVLRSDPLGVGAMVFVESGKQLTHFSYDDLSPTTKRRYINTAFPPEIQASIHASRLWSDDRVMWLGSDIQQIMVIVGLAVLIFGAYTMQRRGTAADRRFLLFAVAVAGGLIVNAVVCGVLASPYDRFQARIVWLVPLLAVISIVVLRAPGRSAERTPMTGACDESD